MEENILEDFKDDESSLRRRDLLPKWVTIFAGIFLIIGALAPVGFVAGMAGVNFHMSMYGLNSNESISVIGIFVTLVFVLKGIVSFGLMKERKWAVDLAIIDAIIGIVACCIVVLVLPLLDGIAGFEFNFRLELIPLGMFLLKMLEIRSSWSIRVSA